MIVLEIPECTPSLNQTLRHGHWSKHVRHRKHWSMLVLVAKSNAGIYGRPNLKRARVTVERYGSRTLDPDNAIGGTKNLIDGLRDNGIIADDTIDDIELHMEQHISRLERKTVVRIEELGARVTA